MYAPLPPAYEVLVVAAAPCAPHASIAYVPVLGTVHVWIVPLAPAPVALTVYVTDLHTPATHASPVAHVVLHVPQWVASVERSTHTPPQSVVPTAHVVLQMPDAHTSVVLQA